MESTTITRAESAAIEEPICEAIVDLNFVAEPPVAGNIATYSAGATYAKGALVKEGAIVYRSQKAANKGHEPKGEADFEWWAPTAVATYPLQKSDYSDAPKARKETVRTTPPASSAASATPAETIGATSEIDLGP